MTMEVKSLWVSSAGHGGSLELISQASPPMMVVSCVQTANAGLKGDSGAISLKTGQAIKGNSTSQFCPHFLF